MPACFGCTFLINRFQILSVSDIVDWSTLIAEDGVNVVFPMVVDVLLMLYATRPAKLKRGSIIATKICFLKL